MLHLVLVKLETLELFSSTSPPPQTRVCHLILHQNSAINFHFRPHITSWPTSLAHLLGILVILIQWANTSWCPWCWRWCSILIMISTFPWRRNWWRKRGTRAISNGFFSYYRRFETAWKLEEVAGAVVVLVLAHIGSNGDFRRPNDDIYTLV